MLLAAKLGGGLAIRLRQPAVLGELIAGIILGNLSFGGAAPLQALAANETIEVIAGIGALILLFEVGIESTVAQMLKVGWTSLLVAVLGVVVPFALGWGVSAWLLPGSSPYVHAFIGATLCATSVGITARVFQDLRASRTQEARIILGAAVIDDVLGLVILGAVSGAIAAAAQGAPFSMLSVARISAAALVFLVGALVIGMFAAPRLFSIASLLQGRGVLVAVSLSLCFALAWASSLIGLAPIVGAFAAGLVLEDVHVKDFVTRGERSLEELIRPIADLLVPVFFVLMGLRTDLRALTSSTDSLELAAALTVVAIIGKQACALGVLTPGVNRLAVGIGMIPRGEVGLIFASVGAGLMLDGVPIIGPSSFSAVVLMVIVTTLVTPPALKWSLR
jgi:Kef-type K+ transport system membrane component KefB